jgi:protein-S-isoprenylcysteine O-methyltransferase Ste14
MTASSGGKLPLGAARWVGVVPLAIGASGLLWCIWDFARVGRGTLAPVDAPRFVVRSGLYRFVRNPMYLSVLTALAGEMLLFRSVRLAIWELVVAISFHSFVIGYEEPRLRRKFGADYETYRTAVPRWLPRRPAGATT